MDSSGHSRAEGALIKPVPLRHPRMLWRFAVMLAVAALLLGGLYFFRTMRDSAIKGIFSRPRPPIVVGLTVAESETVPRFLSGIGTIAAVHQVTVAPQLGGMITKILFTPGQMVKAGEPLVQLDDGPERGDLANYEAQARYAAVTLRRNRELVTRQAAPQATVDQNESQLEQANANIAKTKALIAQKLIAAPFDGRLGVRQVEVGQYVAPGTALVTLTNLAELYINFTLPEQDAAAVSPGQEIEFTVDAYPGQKFKARINAIEPQISADTRTLRTQAVAENPDGKLLPGMFAHVDVVLSPQPDVVTVPETAVENTLYGDSAFLVEQDGVDDKGAPVLKAKRVPVKVGEHIGARVAVLSGLKPGDRVVALGQNKVLFDGATVTPGPAGGLVPPAKPPKN